MYALLLPWGSCRKISSFGSQEVAQTTQPLAFCPGPCAEKLQVKDRLSVPMAELSQGISSACALEPLLWGTAPVTTSASGLRGTCSLLGHCCQFWTGQSPSNPLTLNLSWSRLWRPPEATTSQLWELGISDFTSFTSRFRDECQGWCQRPQVCHSTWTLWAGPAGQTLGGAHFVMPPTNPVAPPSGTPQELLLHSPARSRGSRTSWRGQSRVGRAAVEAHLMPESRQIPPRSVSPLSVLSWQSSDMARKPGSCMEEVAPGGLS